MNADALISVRLPGDVVELIDHLVRAGVVSCRSEALRLAILYKLKSLGYDVDTKGLDSVLSRLKRLEELGK
ncbi:MAG: ribbon-helix-helix domain-containing protein [Sulfolobales archaeon]